MNMNIKTIIVWVATGLTALGATDDEIRGVIWRSSLAFDNPRRNEAGLQHALVMSEYDTNRFTRILQEIALSGTGRVERAMVYDIGRFGNINNLSFLYSCVTNVAYADFAIVALFKIEGVTTNAVDKLCQYLSMPVEGDQVRMFADRTRCCDQILFAHNVTPSRPEHRYLLDALIGFANSTNLIYSWGFDESVSKRDPNYRRSRRRLVALRAVEHLGIENPRVRDLQRAYVTNAINELIAYPEANLND